MGAKKATVPSPGLERIRQNSLSPVNGRETTKKGSLRSLHAMSTNLSKVTTFAQSAKSGAHMPSIPTILKIVSIGTLMVPICTKLIARHVSTLNVQTTLLNCNVRKLNALK